MQPAAFSPQHLVLGQSLATPAEAVGGTEVQGHLWLQSKFPANLACPRPYLKRGNKTHKTHKHSSVLSG